MIFRQQQDVFRVQLEKEDRSLMNIPLLPERKSWMINLWKRSRSGRSVYLKGHRTVGGMRSLYNAMPMEV